MQHSHSLFSQILILIIQFFLYASNKMNKPFYRMANIFFASTKFESNYPCPVRLFSNINIPNLHRDFFLCMLPNKTFFILASTSFSFLLLSLSFLLYISSSSGLSALLVPLCLSIFLTGGCCFMQHPSREKESTLVNDELN